MSEERDEILTKLRALHDTFSQSVYDFSGRETPYTDGLYQAYRDTVARLGEFILSLDPDADLPIEDPLMWHSDFLSYYEVVKHSIAGGKLRRCFQCSQCKAGLEVEFPDDKENHRKRVRCSCNHVQLVVCFN